ncbi:hypothetical protein [Lewinella cohaerens]|uniref:hypothetical protein n=1 Tax=Lewinella cohaerens TaxID=70995 RepID=UPI0004755E61|nr:hypothetical protein [Lewinella cohaerens]
MDRIFFKNNPYPNGHRIQEFCWSGRLIKGRGLVFDFHLVTENYYEEDDSDEEEEEANSDWEAKMAWANFHQCTMSSTFWNGNGAVIGTKDSPLDFSNLLDRTLTIDPLPDANDYHPHVFALDIYLLGHDKCANHHISFTKQYNNSTFNIEWRGNIALFYSGDNEFKYTFETKIRNCKFAGIHLDKRLSLAENSAILKACTLDSNAFELKDGKFELKR